MAGRRCAEDIAGFRLEEVEEVTSTSDHCIDRATAGEPDGLAIRANRQTAARGSRGRSWAAPAGNLYISILLRPRPGGAAEGMVGGWALIGGLVLLEALEACGACDLMLKWPNDVLMAGATPAGATPAGAKLGGVLVEIGRDAVRPGGEAASGIDWLVIGLGANLAVAPEVAGRAVAGLGPKAPEAAAVGRAVLLRLAHWRALFETEGLAPIRAAWLARAHPLGTPVTVKRWDSSEEGLFAGLAPDGALLLRQGEVVHTISTGDVLLSKRG